MSQDTTGNLEFKNTQRKRRDDKMKYIFYGVDEWKMYATVENSSGMYLDTKLVPVKNEKEIIHEQDCLSPIFKTGDKIIKDGNIVEIEEIYYDITDDVYRCYTNYIINCKEDDISKEHALKRIDTFKKARDSYEQQWHGESEKKVGFFSRLFNR